MKKTRVGRDTDAGHSSSGKQISGYSNWTNTSKKCNVHKNHLEILIKFRFWFRMLEVVPGSLRF